MSKHKGEKCEKRADGDPDGRRVGRRVGRTDGRTESGTDGDPDGHYHIIKRPVWRREYEKSREWRRAYKKIKGVIVKHYSMPPGGNKVEKAIFSFKVKVKVIDLGVIWKGIISGVCMPNMKSLSLTVQML